MKEYKDFDLGRNSRLSVWKIRADETTVGNHGLIHIQVLISIFKMILGDILTDFKFGIGEI